MAEEITADIMVTTRVTKPIYAKILQRQRKAEQLTGIAPSVSAVVRSMIAEAASNGEATGRRAKRRPTASERAA